MRPHGLRQVSNRHRWSECTSTCGCAPDGQNCVRLADDEDVVCWHDDYGKPCTDGCQIDGTACLIKTNVQEIRWTRLPPGRQKRDFRFDHGTGVCDLVNHRSAAFKVDWGRSSLWEKSAIVIMDMWDKHPTPGTGARAAELAPAINAFVTRARSLGALIVHSPSCDTLTGSFAGRYDSHPARHRAIAARDECFPPFGAFNEGVTRQFYYYLSNGDKIKSGDFNTVLSNNDGCPSKDPRRDPAYEGQPGGQTERIDILDTGPAGGDVISADGLGLISSGIGAGNSAYGELLALTLDRPYIVYCGINTNMCILRRTNGMRTMYQAGKSLWLVSDLTDAMVGASTTGLVQWAREVDHTGSVPNGNYNHYQGTQIVVDWIGRNLMAFTGDSSLIGGDIKRFRFQDDPS